MSLDVIGELIDIIDGSEKIYIVKSNNKIIKIGSNHPKLIIREYEYLG